jgi:hypothetical protein
MRFRLHCSFTEICGLGVSRYGDCQRGPAAAVDRAFGRFLAFQVHTPTVSQSASNR